VRRRPLGVLFLVLSVGFAAVAIFAASAGGGAWVIALASGALAVWMGELAYRALR
jgi:L-serine deaminase